MNGRRAPTLPFNALSEDHELTGLGNRLVATMRKILVMISAGEIYDHDCVRWYRAHDVQRWIEHYHNIGDAFVLDSSLKLLDYDVVRAVDVRQVDDEKIERFNEEFDYCFLRGSNYIHDSVNWHCTAQIIEKLKIPVIAFGIGAQASHTGAISVSADTRRIMQLIGDHCHSIGVRGDFSAQVLADLGLTNVRVIGCPTLFRHNNPELRIDLPALEQVRKVGYTLRREVSASYARDVARYLAVQRETILALAERYDLTVLTQGEVEEKKVALGTPEQRTAALAALAGRGWLGDRTIEPGPDLLAQIYHDRLFYSDVVADYDRVTRQQDLVLGFRLHGNLIALANGVPAIYYSYDSRTSEFADFLKIPVYDVFSGHPFHLEEYWDQALFEPFNRAYPRAYDNMREFLDENGIAHRMRPVPAKEKADHVA